MILNIIVPCYNEEETLNYSSGKLTEKLNYLIDNKYISNDSKIYFVDDGSKDNSWNIIENLRINNKYIYGIKLTRNYGHQNAILAGMFHSKKADAYITIDADLQDDINAIDKMIIKYKNGNDIVYGVRSSRDSDTYFKRNSALMFYKTMSLLGVEIKENHADFRLMSYKSVEKLKTFTEKNLFLRAMIPLIGYKNDIVYYERKERVLGESKYPLSKMISFALNGITSFSTPLNPPIITCSPIRTN